MGEVLWFYQLRNRPLISFLFTITFSIGIPHLPHWFVSCEITGSGVFLTKRKGGRITTRWYVGGDSSGNIRHRLVVQFVAPLDL